MTVGDYLLIPLILFTILLYPLLWKGVSLLEIFVRKYTQQLAQQQDQLEKQPENTSLQTLLNLKLLAYERIILLIERIKPDSLIPRTLSPALKSKEYHALLLNEIRKEFEYNLSQQLYLSEPAWKVTVSFKDHIITLINSAAAGYPSDNAHELAKRILEHYIASDLKAEDIVKLIKQDIQ